MTDQAELTLNELYAAGNDAYQERGDYDAAIEIFRRVVARAPDWPKARLKLGGLLQYRAQGRAATGHLSDAVRDFREAYRVSPDTPKLLPRFRQALRDLGFERVASGDFDEARSVLVEAAALGDEDDQARLLLEMLEAAGTDDLPFVQSAVARLLDDGNGQALEALRRLVAQMPEALFARQALVACLVQVARESEQEGDLERAVQCLDEALQADPGDEALKRNLVDALHRAGTTAAAAVDVDGARRLVERALVVDPDHAQARRLRSVLERMPTEAFDEYSDPVRGSDGTRLPDLVLIEEGVDRRLLPPYLQVFEGSEFYAEFRFDSTANNTRVSSLLDLRSVGGSEDAAVAAEAGQLFAVIGDALASASPRRWTYRTANVLDLMSFEFEDAVFRVLRKLEIAADLMDAERYGRVVVVAARGGLAGSLRPLLDEAFGPDRVYTMWCSPSRDLYSTRATSGFPDELSGTTASDETSRRAWWAPLMRERLTRPDRSELSQGRAPVLLLTSPGRLHVSSGARAIAPVVEETPAVAVLLHKAKHQVFEPLRLLEEAQPDRFRLQELGHLEVAEQWNAAAERTIGDLLADLSRDRRIADASIGGVPVWPLLQAELRRILQVRLPLLRSFAAAFGRVLETLEPRAIMVSPDRMSEARVACTLARAVGIPTFFPQAVFFSDSPRYKPLQADYIFVIDQFTRRLYVDHFGADPDRVLVTGIPRLDPIYDRRSEPLPDESDEKVVLLILQRFSLDYTRNLLGLVADAVAATEDVVLMARMHPGDAQQNRHAYQAVLDERLPAGRGRVARGEDLYDQIREAQVVVSTFSNVVLEAAMLSRPVLCLNLTGEPLPIPFVEEGAAVGVEREGDVSDAIHRLLFDDRFRNEARERQEQYFALNHHLVEGRAGERIARIIHVLSAPDDQSD